MLEKLQADLARLDAKVASEQAETGKGGSLETAIARREVLAKIQDLRRGLSESDRLRRADERLHVINHLLRRKVSKNASLPRTPS